jgi:hypothetical protein
MCSTCAFFLDWLTQAAMAKIAPRMDKELRLRFTLRSRCATQTISISHLLQLLAFPVHYLSVTDALPALWKAPLALCKTASSTAKEETTALQNARAASISSAFQYSTPALEIRIFEQ